jgi:predicted ATP-grasp superfamily ATP-dependent carboligase
MDKFTKYVNLPISDFNIMKIASNKKKVFKFAKKIKVPIPQTFYPNNIKEVKEISKEITYPVVLKGNEDLKNLYYINSKKELIMNYESIMKISQQLNNNKKYNDNDYDSNDQNSDLGIMIQEYIKGDGFGFFALLNHGKPRAIFSHKRIREFPITGGPSTAAESVFDPKLKEHGLELLKKLNWHGSAMVEFKKDIRDGSFKLMELNPKFWGSLELAIASGVDFPYLTCCMAIDGDIKPVFDYKQGVRFRWLLPGEIFHLLANFKFFPQFIQDTFNKRCKYDIWFTDFKPNLKQILSILPEFLHQIESGHFKYPHGKPNNMR